MPRCALHIVPKNCELIVMDQLEDGILTLASIAKFIRVDREFD